jgi:hypothetical protein
MNRRWHDPWRRHNLRLNRSRENSGLRQSGVARRILNIEVAKVGLDSSRIVTVVGVLVAVREGKRANAPEAHAPVRSLV